MTRTSDNPIQRTAAQWFAQLQDSEVTVDEMLAWQTQEFLRREASRDAYTVYVRPEIVVEVAFNEVQESSQYPGGLALRFARVKGYRPDKRAEEADTIETVRRIHAAQEGR